VLTLLVVADLALDDRRWWKGALIGIGTGLKLTPGLFIVYLVLTRRFRAAAVATGSFALTAAIGFLALPEQSRQFWTPETLGSLSTRIDPSDLQNQSINGALLRALEPDTARHVWLVAAALVAAVGLALTVGLHRRYGEFAGMLSAALVSLLISPISWTHYWIWMVPAVAGLGRLAVTHRSVRSAAALLAGCALFLAYPMRLDPRTGGWSDRFELLPKGLVWTAPQADRLELTWSGAELLRGNLYVIFGVLLSAAAVAWFVRSGGWKVTLRDKRGVIARDSPCIQTAGATGSVAAPECRPIPADTATRRT
jgi:alpha-1,2-mannosyltransferase